MTYLAYFPLLSALLSLIVVIITFKTSRKYGGIFFYYLTLSSVNELGLFIVSRLGYTNHWLANIYIIAEFILLALYMQRIAFYKQLPRKIILLFISLFSILWLITSANNSFTKISTTVVIIEALLISAMAGVSILKLLKRDIRLTTNYHFLTLTGILFSFLVSMLSFSAINITYQNEFPEWYTSYFITVIAISNLTSYLIYSYAFLCLSKKKISSSY